MGALDGGVTDVLANMANGASSWRRRQTPSDY
jgi:hypothetical protein